MHNWPCYTSTSCSKLLASAPLELTVFNFSPSILSFSLLTFCSSSSFFHPSLIRFSKTHLLNQSYINFFVTFLFSLPLLPPASSFSSIFLSSFTSLFKTNLKINSNLLQIKTLALQNIDPNSKLVPSFSIKSKLKPKIFAFFPNLNLLLSPNPFPNPNPKSSPSFYC